MNIRIKNLPEDEGTFNAIREQIAARAANYLRHGNIVKDVTESVVLSLLHREDSDTELDAWIIRQLERETEAHVEKLWHFTFGYALSLTDDPDKAQDITQTVMVAFLNTKKHILFIKGWLRRTTYNLVMKAYHDASHETAIKHELDAQLKIESQSPDEDLDDLREAMTLKDIKRILSPSEFAEWNGMQGFKSVKEYAEQNALSYGGARKRKHILVKKIKSCFLREQGWIDTPEILDYQTLKNIKRFMNTLVEYSAGTGLNELRRYCPVKLRAELRNYLAGFVNVDDWGVHLDSANQYQINIVDASIQHEPKIALICIRINRSNQIRIVDCYVPALIGSALECVVEPLPMDKGRCLLTIEDVIRLIQ